MPFFLEVALFVVGVLSLLVGVVKFRTSWGARLALFGVLLLATSLALNWTEFMEGFRAGYQPG